MIRQLTVDDLPAASDMVGIKPRTSGTVPITKESFVDGFANYFAEVPDHYAFGYLENDELVCFLCMGFFENKMRGKFWIIPALYTKNFKPVFNFKDPDMASLLKYAFEFAEDKGYYEFYYSVGERIMNAYERQWQRNSVMETGRYELILLDTVPARTKPEFELYWRLMGQELKPDTIVIKKRVLREQYRKKILYTPLDIPKIEPNNWDEWWEVWKTYSGTSIQANGSHNGKTSSGQWRSLELYRGTGVNLDNAVHVYPKCPQDIPVVQDLIKKIKEYFPTKVTHLVVLENLAFIKFHSDEIYPAHYIRALLWGTNNKVNWLLKKDTDVKLIELPQDSNTFCYLDFVTKHCADYNPSKSKGLLVIGFDNNEEIQKLIRESASKYKGLAWTMQIDI
jgi:hypothetical protein